MPARMRVLSESPIPRSSRTLPRSGHETDKFSVKKLLLRNGASWLGGTDVFTFIPLSCLDFRWSDAAGRLYRLGNRQLNHRLRAAIAPAEHLRTASERGAPDAGDQC